MSLSLETTVETATRMGERWRAPTVKTMLDFGGGLSANLLTAPRGEIFALPSEAHIFSLTFLADPDHRQWRDNHVIHTGVMPARGVNLVRAGEMPRAVLSTSARVLHLYIPNEVLAEAARDAGVAGAPSAIELVDPCFAPDPVSTMLLEQAALVLAADHPLDRLWRESLAKAICVRLLHRWSNFDRTAAHIAQKPAASCDWRLRRAIDLLEARLGEDMGLTELASTIDISPTHLTNLFRRGTGDTPHRWLMRRRVQRACELLTDPRRSVTEIAHACGFASSQHMATVFRRQLGTTPSNWRRERLA